MKNLLFILLIVSTVGCVSGNRSALVTHSNFVPEGGKEIKSVSFRVPWLFELNIGKIQLGLKDADLADVSVNGGSAFSKTGLAGLTANTTSTRNGANVVDTVGYDVKELNTDVSTNAPAAIGAIGTGVGNVIKESLRPTP